jgi:PadR family transcriptional regulator PadR
MQNYSNHDQLVRGMLYFAVLSNLDTKDNYPAKLLIALEKTPFKTQAGTLYPLMSRMEKSDLLSSRWVIKEGKPPMKYYKNTKQGKVVLSELRKTLIEINKILEG